MILLSDQSYTGNVYMVKNAQQLHGEGRRLEGPTFRIVKWMKVL